MQHLRARANVTLIIYLIALWLVVWEIGPTLFYIPSLWLPALLPIGDEFFCIVLLAWILVSVIMSSTKGVRGQIPAFTQIVFVAFWISVLLAAMIALILALLDWWFAFALVEDWGDGNYINLRGISPKTWPFLLLCGILWAITVALLWFSNRVRRISTNARGTLAMLVLGIVTVVVSVLVHEFPYRSSHYIYTGYALAEVLSVLVVLWSIGVLLWGWVKKGQFMTEEGGREGLCESCGYVLYGLTEPRCPECGTAFDPAILGMPGPLSLGRAGLTRRSG